MFKTFGLDEGVRYHPFNDDFGPMNMAATTKFAQQLKNKISICKSDACNQLAFSVDAGRRSLSNAILLLGSFMILKMEMHLRDVSAFKQ